MLDTNKICQFGKQVIEDEIQALQNLSVRIDSEFVKACEILLNCKGHVIVTGMGKSGHIANKMAATLASTGTPAFFLHPGEANHGDFGAATANDVVVAISNSGSTSDIISLLTAIKYLNIPLIAFTGNPNSVIAKAATIHIDISIEKEACPLGLAPTCSTTAALVMGDAIAIALLSVREFTAKEYALNHPGGTLGKRLLLKAGDLMHVGKNIPIVTKHTNLKEVLLEMTSKRLGMVNIIDENNILMGIFTDGDLRRVFSQGSNITDIRINEIMISNCKTIPADYLAVDALKLMEKYSITSLPVVDNKHKILGVLHIHDILKSGLSPINI